jgi:hypothetical protein
MKRLARQIANDLRKSKVSAVYNSELARVFPKNVPAEERHEMIRRFASEHGLEVAIFEVGLCAIFEKGLKKSKVPNRKSTRAPTRSRHKLGS